MILTRLQVHRSGKSTTNQRGGNRVAAIRLQVLGMQTGPDEPMSIAAYLADRHDMWDEVVRAHGLQPIALDVLLGESHHYADLCFACGASEAPPPTFVSTIKIKQAGFTDTCNSEESFCHWLRDLQSRRILPNPERG